MKIIVQRPVEIIAKTLLIEAPVRYGEEDIPNDFPKRHGDLWKIKVDIDTGRIMEWPKGFKASVHMKVCDEGKYFLYDNRGAELAKIEDYVPDCVPGRYGDYIEMTIAGDGRIKEWARECTPESLARSFFQRAITSDARAYASCGS